MHITIAFFPDLEDKYIPVIEDIFSKLNNPPIQIDCIGMALFKRRRVPSTLVVDIKSPTLLKYGEHLRRNIEEADIYFKKENVFTPHITVGRIKEVYDEDKFYDSYRYLVKNFKSSQFKARQIILFSSNMITYSALVTREFLDN